MSPFAMLDNGGAPLKLRSPAHLRPESAKVDLWQVTHIYKEDADIGCQDAFADFNNGVR